VTRAPDPAVRRADLHVHSCHSLQSGNLRFLRSRDCYSRPEDVYRTAKARGMDFVTITDHDSIAGCLEFLDRHPAAADFFISEEVSCRFPGSRLDVHIGAYGLSETLHRDVQLLRDNVFDVCGLLRERGVCFSLNHLLHFYRDQVPLDDYLRLLSEVPALETRNGTMLAAHNELVTALASRRGDGSPGLGRVGGSDAHTLRRVGLTWTEAAGGTPAEFLASLAAGRSDTGGRHGSARSIAADAYGVIGAYVASLLGLGPRDHSGLHRAACLLFSAVSLPGQILPFIIATTGKRAEARQVRRVSRVVEDVLSRIDAEAGATA
jgi:predicted metal-dependent phosphoesterase TrpH